MKMTMIVVVVAENSQDDDEDDHIDGVDDSGAEACDDNENDVNDG